MITWTTIQHLWLPVRKPVLKRDRCSTNCQQTKCRTARLFAINVYRVRRDFRWITCRKYFPSLNLQLTFVDSSFFSQKQVTFMGFSCDLDSVLEAPIEDKGFGRFAVTHKVRYSTEHAFYLPWWFRSNTDSSQSSLLIVGDNSRLYIPFS